MLLQIVISDTTFKVCIIAFLVSLFLVGLLFKMIGAASGYREGLRYGESLYNGLPIELDKKWLGTSLWVGSVFKPLENTQSKKYYEYLLEAYTHPDSKMVRLFKITEAQYNQLIVENEEPGKQYLYLPRTVRPGVDEYYFRPVLIA